MRTTMLTVCFLIALTTIGCAPSTRTLQVRTSALTGCAPDTIKISHVKVDFKTGSYTAECGGDTYDCYGDDYFRDVKCTERGRKPEPQSTATKAAPSEPQEQQPQLPAPLVVARNAPTDPENTLSRGLETLSQQLAASLPDDKKLTVAVLDFNDLAGNVSALGRLVNEELVTKLFQTRRVKVIERGLLEKAINELKFTLSGLVDPNRAKQLGKQVGADAIVTGTIADLGSIVKINARLIEVEKGDVVAAAGVEVIKDRVISELMRQLLSGIAQAPPVPKEGPQEPALESQPAIQALKYQEFSKLRVEVEDFRVGYHQITVFLAYINKTAEDLFVALDASDNVRGTYLLDDEGRRYGFERATGLAGGWDRTRFGDGTSFLTLPPNERVPVTLSFAGTGRDHSEGAKFDLVSAQVFVTRDKRGQAGPLNVSIRRIVPQ